MIKRNDLTGQRFGKLTVRSRVGRNNQGEATWHCRCDCGGDTLVSTARLRNGNTKSCGCLTNTTHGMTGTKIYETWHSMKKRCNNPRNKNYGERGISVCERWEKFENFYEDMGDQPEGLTIERIDNGGNYEPENCRWATQAEQTRNTRRSIRIKYKGEVKCVAEWSRIIGVPKNTLYRRLRDNPVEIAFNM